MQQYIDIKRTFVVPVSSAGAEDDIEITVDLEIAYNKDEAWLEGVRREDGEHVSQFDALFARAEAWVDEHQDEIIREEF